MAAPASFLTTQVVVPRPETRPPVFWSAQITRTQDGIVVTLCGFVDAASAGLLDHLLTDLVVGQGNRVVTLDASEIVSPDVSFAGVARAAHARGARFAVIRRSDLQAKDRSA